MEEYEIFQYSADRGIRPSYHTTFPLIRLEGDCISIFLVQFVSHMRPTPLTQHPTTKISSFGHKTLIMRLFAGMFTAKLLKVDHVTGSCDEGLVWPPVGVYIKNYCPLVFN